MRALALGCVTIALALTACSSGQEPKPAARTAPIGAVTIAVNTQVTLDDVKIGVGNIWDDDYYDGQGGVAHGLTAGVWLSTHGLDGKPIRVHPGQVVEAGKLKLEVKQIDSGEITLALSS